MTVIPRMTTLPGAMLTWWPLRIDRRTSAIIRCPNGHVNTLGKDHAIDDCGFVTPEVECPKDTCDWRANVQLSEWVAE